MDMMEKAVTAFETIVFLAAVFVCVIITRGIVYYLCQPWY